MQYFEDFLDKMQQQAQADKQLHMRALANPHRFDRQQQQQLAADKHTKEEFQAILDQVKSGQLPALPKLLDLIEKLEYDKNTHYHYLHKPPSANTGDPGFQHYWIKIYDGWLKFLRKLVKRHGS